MSVLKKPSTYESELLLESSPNILENLTYEEYDNTTIILMEKSPTFNNRRHVQQAHQTKHQQQKRPQSPKFSPTIEKNLFMKNVINIPSPPTTPSTTNTSIPIKLESEIKNNLQDKESSLHRSLEEISNDIKDIDDFITVTENIIRKERERDRELYAREKRRKTLYERKNLIEIPNKENKIPSPNKKILSPTKRRQYYGPKSPPTFKINAYKPKKSKTSFISPRFSNSKLYFRNGRIGCVEAEHQLNISNIQSTHALIKHILKYENEKPLVSPENVQKVLNEIHNEKNRRKQQQQQQQIEKNIKDIKDIPENWAEETRTESVQPQKQKSIDDVIFKVKSEQFDAIKDKIKHQNNSSENNDDDVVLYDLEDIPLDSESLAIPPTTLESDEYHQKSPLDECERSVKSPESTTSDRLKTLDSDSQQFVREQVRHLVRRFTARTSHMRTRLELPPTPSSSASSPSPPPPSHYEHDPEIITIKPTSPLESSEIASPSGTIGPNGRQQNFFEADHQSINSGALLCGGLCGTSKNEGVLDPQGRIYISWLCIVSVSFLYNTWVIPLRSAFPFQTPENTNYWLIMDFIADLIYLLDIIFFKHRVMYLFEGFWVKDKNLTRKNYMRKLQFKLDILSLIPLDLLYFKYGTNAVYLRFPRFFKIQSFWDVFRLLDRVISSPHFVRVAKTLTYMLYMIHCTACAYYAYSSYEGLGTNRWVFSGKGHPYVRCFAFATKTATSIGKNPKPEKEGELLFMTVAWLMGVFVFALLIGQIRDIIGTATRSQSEYRQLEDETLEYMRRLNLPSEIQKRVKMWFKFTWDQQRALDESHILDNLPINLKTDIAIAVHIQTLSKVQLFADCEEALLRELVLKLRSVTFLPGDYVCRKGEVGKEMYIVKLGQVQVMGGPNNDEVLATLSEGSVFGEISLLAINGEQGNRRTADVKSKGFSNLFVLSKNDLNEAIVYYPNAQAILRRRAKSLIRKNIAREREEARRMKVDVIIGNPQTPEDQPKLLKTVIEALPEESPTVVLLTRGSKRYSKHKIESKRNDENEKKEEEKKISSSKTMICRGVGAGTDDDQQKMHASEDNSHRPVSPSLLASIQDELKNKNHLINLTDSQKALIVSSSSSTSSSKSSLNSNNGETCDIALEKKE